MTSLPRRFKHSAWLLPFNASVTTFSHNIHRLCHVHLHAYTASSHARRITGERPWGKISKKVSGVLCWCCVGSHLEDHGGGGSGGVRGGRATVRALDRDERHVDVSACSSSRLFIRAICQQRYSTHNAISSVYAWDTYDPSNLAVKLMDTHIHRQGRKRQHWWYSLMDGEACEYLPTLHEAA